MGESLRSRIRAGLKAKGKTARAASIEAGLSADGIRNILRGKSDNPRDDTMGKIRAYFGWDLSPGSTAGVNHLEKDVKDNGSAQAEEPMSPDERQLLDVYRHLSSSGRAEALKDVKARAFDEDISPPFDARQRR